MFVQKLVVGLLVLPVSVLCLPNNLRIDISISDDSHDLPKHISSKIAPLSVPSIRDQSTIMWEHPSTQVYYPYDRRYRLFTVDFNEIALGEVNGTITLGKDEGSPYGIYNITGGQILDTSEGTELWKYFPNDIKRIWATSNSSSLSIENSEAWFPHLGATLGYFGLEEDGKPAPRYGLANATVTTNASKKLDAVEIGFSDFAKNFQFNATDNTTLKAVKLDFGAWDFDNNTMDIGDFGYVAELYFKFSFF